MATAAFREATRAKGMAKRAPSECTGATWNTTDAILAVTLITWQAKAASRHANGASLDSDVAAHDTNATSVDTNAASLETNVTSVHTTAISARAHDTLQRAD